MYQNTLLPLVITLWVTSAEVKEEKQSETTSQCLMHIIHEYLNDSKKISVRYNDEERQKMVLEELLKHTDNPIMVNADEYPRGVHLDDRIPSDAALILSEDVSVAEYLESNLYTARTVFFVVFWGNGEKIAGTFATFWNQNLVNAYALQVQEDDVYVYEYIPYENCDINEPVVLDKWSEGGFSYGRIGRIKKAPITHVNGCPLVVSVPHVPPTIIFPDRSEIHGTKVISGLEGLMWMTISEKVNSTFMYHVPTDGSFWGFVHPPSGAVGEIIRKKAHFAGGGPSMTLDRLSALEVIVWTSGASDVVIWVVPKGAAKSHPVWLKIFTVEFTPVTWICLAATLALALVTYFVVSRMAKTPSGLFNSFLVLFSASLREPVKMPQSKPLKILIASWVWYTLIIMTAYESVMRSTLTVPIRHQELNTLRELLESGIDLYGIDTTIKVALKGTNDPYKEAMAKKVKIWNSTMEHIMNRLARERGIGYMREKLTVDYFLYNHKDLIASTHQVKQYVFMYYQTVYVAKRLPIYPRVYSIVAHLRESGIPLWWRSQYIRPSYPLQPKAVKLTIEHMTAPFTILGVGSMLAIIAFISEHCEYTRKSKGTTKRAVP